MVDVFRPGVFLPKFSFDPLFFAPHQFQNLIVLVFVQPETMFGTAINLQIEEAIIKLPERGRANRTFKFCRLTDNIKRTFVRLIAESLVFKLIQFGGRKPHSLATRTSFEFNAAIILRLKVNIAFWTFHCARILELIAQLQRCVHTPISSFQSSGPALMKSRIRNRAKCCRMTCGLPSQISTTCLYSGTMTCAFGFIARKVSAWARHCVSSPWMQTIFLMSPDSFST